jgi:hypothetical protein
VSDTVRFSTKEKLMATRLAAVCPHCHSPLLELTLQDEDVWETMLAFAQGDPYISTNAKPRDSTPQAGSASRSALIDRVTSSGVRIFVGTNRTPRVVLVDNWRHSRPESWTVRQLCV